MRYRFITVLHNMKLDSTKNKGIKLFNGARLTNGRQVKGEILNTNLFKSTVGIHSIDEFEDAVYLYIDGEFEEIMTQEDMDKVGNEYTFYFLRIAQQFTMELWKLKDNNVYVRDGFLLTYNQQFNDGSTFKASLSAMPSFATNFDGYSLFSDEEIKIAVFKLTPYEFDEGGMGWKYPTSEHFYKKSGLERVDRAMYFSMAARNSPTLPMKIVSYCTALECLFTSGTLEISHKIAERVALLLGVKSDEKMELYKLVKKAYGYRSTIIHGATLKGSDENLVEMSEKLDSILRDLIVAENEVFLKNDADMENYFAELLFRV